MDQAFDAGLELDERTVVGDVGHAASELGFDWVFGGNAFPGIGLELLHAQRNTMAFLIDADDLDLDGLADRQDFVGVVDAAPCDVGDVQQAVDAAEINERTVIGDVLDDAFDHLALFELLDDFRTLFGARFFENGTARNDDIAAALVHFQNLEGLRHVHQGRDVADGADIDLGARQEGHGAVEIDGETALDLVEDLAFDLFALVVKDFEADPAFFAAGLLTGEDSLAHGVLDAVDIDFDFRAHGNGAVAASGAEFLHRHAAFGLQSHVDDGEVFFDSDDLAFDNGALDGIDVLKALKKELFEIFCRCDLVSH